MLEISGQSVYNRPDLGVVEFQSPWTLFEYTANGTLVLLQPILFLHLGIALAVVAVFLGRRRLALLDVLLLAAFGYLLWQAQKNFGYFAVATGPAVVAGLAARPLPRRVASGLGIAVIAACAVGCLQIRSGWLYAQQRVPHRFGLVRVGLLDATRAKRLDQSRIDVAGPRRVPRGLRRNVPDRGDDLVGADLDVRARRRLGARNCGDGTGIRAKVAEGVLQRLILVPGEARQRA